MGEVKEDSWCQGRQEQVSFRCISCRSGPRKVWEQGEEESEDQGVYHFYTRLCAGQKVMIIIAKVRVRFTGVIGITGVKHSSPV